MPTHRFILFVHGGSATSGRAIAALSQIHDVALTEEISFEVVDVAEDPESAEKWRILATPTLLRVSPEPQRRLIGDLSDAATVWAMMGEPLLDRNAGCK